MKQLVDVRDDEENINEKIIFQDDEIHDNIDFNYVDDINQANY